jgi:hypothetical protein
MQEMPVADVYADMAVEKAGGEKEKITRSQYFAGDIPSNFDQFIRRPGQEYAETCLEGDIDKTGAINPVSVQSAESIRCPLPLSVLLVERLFNLGCVVQVNSRYCIRGDGSERSFSGLEAATYCNDREDYYKKNGRKSHGKGLGRVVKSNSQKLTTCLLYTRIIKREIFLSAFAKRKMTLLI